MPSKYKIIATQDESTTLLSEQFGEHYHSVFGAENESQFIYIDAGLSQIEKEKICIFEMGMGTGLNVLLSIEYALKNNKTIDYHTIEKYPIPLETVANLQFKSPAYRYLGSIHCAPWNEAVALDKQFTLNKYQDDIRKHIHQHKYDIVFYDAFSYDTQSDLWSENVFQSIYEALNEGGLLLTYSVKGVIKRNLRACGFTVKRLKGPEGKREILKAIKE